MAAKKFVQSQTLYLAGSGVLIGATSVVLTSLTDIYGNAITNISSFGDKGYITLEPDTSNEEGATFTSVTANANGTVTLGGVSTILAQYPYTETSGLVRAHSGGTKVVVTDNVAFWATFGNINNANTWADVQTFSVPAIQATDPTASGQVANKHYVDGVAVSGAPNASTTVKGIVQEATQAQVLSKTAVGSTGAELYVSPATLNDTLLSDYKADTGAADAYAIAPSPAITAYTTGQIFSFKAANANTTAATLNVNGLGTKTIKKLGATDLIANDILAGQIVIVEYDGTNFQMLNPVGNTPLPTQTSNSGKLLTTNGTAASWTASPKVLVSNTAASSSSATTETTLFTVSLPGGVLSTNNAVMIRIYVSVLQLSNTKTCTLRLKYGSTTLVANVLTNSTGSTSSGEGGIIEAYIAGNGSTSSQSGFLGYSPWAASTSSLLDQGGTVTGTAAEASAGALTLSVTSQFNNSSSSDKITASNCVMTLIS